MPLTAGRMSIGHIWRHALLIAFGVEGIAVVLCETITQSRDRGAVASASNRLVGVDIMFLRRSRIDMT